MRATGDVSTHAVKKRQDVTPPGGECCGTAAMAAGVMSFFGRSFVLLWQGQIVSQLGNQAFLIAAAYFTLDGTGSTTLVGAVMMASTVPLVLLGPVGGTIADHHSRRAILITTDVFRGLAVGVLAVFFVSRREVATAHIMLLIAVATFNGIMAAVFTPAVHAIVPDLVQKDRLASANAVSQISSQVAVLAGQALGGVLYLRLGAPVLLLFDALSFGYAALATAFIPPDRPREQADGTHVWRTMTRYIVETRQGLTYVRQQPRLLSLLVTFAGVNFLFMPVFVLLPLYVRIALGAGPEWYGFLLAGSGAGALCGAALTGFLRSNGRTDDTVVAACIGGIVGSILVLSATTTTWIAFIAMVATGGSAAAINVVVITIFQAGTPVDIRARVMALAVALSTAAVPLGMALGGVMGDVWRESLRSVFAACGACMTPLMLTAMRSGPHRRAPIA